MIENKIKKLGKFIFISILILISITMVPIIINYFILTWRAPGVIGDSKDWLGFLANYSGGIIGGLIAYLIASYQVNVESKRIEERRKEEEENLIKEKEKEERNFNRYIELLIIPEIKMNVRKFYFTEYEEFKRYFNDEIDYQKKINFKTKEYYDFKPVMLNRSTWFEKDILEIYRAFKMLDGEDEFIKLNKEELKFIIEKMEFWKIKLDL